MNINEHIAYNTSTKSVFRKEEKQQSKDVNTTVLLLLIEGEISLWKGPDFRFRGDPEETKQKGGHSHWYNRVNDK